MQFDIVKYFHRASDDYCIALRFPHGKGFILFTEDGPKLTTRSPFEARCISSTTEVKCELHEKIGVWIELTQAIEGLCVPLVSAMRTLGDQCQKRHGQSA
jgi:hypothetical protein